MGNGWVNSIKIYYTTFSKKLIKILKENISWTGAEEPQLRLLLASYHMCRCACTYTFRSPTNPTHPCMSGLQGRELLSGCPDQGLLLSEPCPAENVSSPQEPEPIGRGMANSFLETRKSISKGNRTELPPPAARQCQSLEGAMKNTTDVDGLVRPAVHLLCPALIPRLHPRVFLSRHGIRGLYIPHTG